MHEQLLKEAAQAARGVIDDMRTLWDGTDPDAVAANDILNNVEVVIDGMERRDNSAMFGVVFISFLNGVSDTMETLQRLGEVRSPLAWQEIKDRRRAEARPGPMPVTDRMRDSLRSLGLNPDEVELYDIRDIFGRH